MESMHVIDLETQSVQKGIHAFKPMYDQVGLGWIWYVNRPLILPTPPRVVCANRSMIRSFTKIPIISTVAEKAYNVWAKQRMRVTGRPPIDTVCSQREERLKSQNQPDADNQ